MSLEKAIYSLITTDSAINALIGVRFYPQQAVQSVSESYCTYKVLSIVNQPFFDGQAAIKTARVQVDCFGSGEDSYSNSVEIAEAVKGLYGAASTVLSIKFLLITIDEDSDIYSSETDRNYRSIDLLIHYKDV